MSWSGQTKLMRTGIFGGTFDPPHIGHLILAQEAQVQLALDQVLWVLTPYPPHKANQKISPINDRHSMTLLAITNNSQFRLSRVDIDRDPPHYAADTVAILREKSPKDEYYYLMGADSLNDLSAWHDPERFISLCHGIGVMVRHGESSDTALLQQQIPGLGAKVHFLETPCIEISGSEIRNRAAIGQQFRYFVQDAIFHYILNHKLYQS
jgi:nicotinate-nucleotide adenylyltransferase